MCTISGMTFRAPLCMLSQINTSFTWMVRHKMEQYFFPIVVNRTSFLTEVSLSSLRYEQVFKKLLTTSLKKGINIAYMFFILAQQPPVGYCLPIHEVSRSHSDTPHSAGLLWTSDQLVAKTST